MKITELKINPRNPQKFTDEAIETLMSSIKTFPKMLTLRPIVYDPKTMYVLGGNKRLICLQKLGYKEIPDNWIKSADELTEDEKKRFTVQDNIQSGTFDLELLDEDFEQEELEEWGLDFGEFEEEPVEAKEDNYEIPEEIKTDIKEGDLIEIGEHRLMCGDSTDSEQVAKLMNGEKADMVFTDPPFEIEINPEILDNLIENGNIFLFQNDRETINYLNRSVFNFKKFFVFYHSGCAIPQEGGHETFLTHILISHETKGIFKKLKNDFGLRSVITGEYRKSKLHKHEKPLSLLSDIIRGYSDKNEIIVDLFGGSGSTMAAAKQLSRKCYMMELEPKNCQIIINRMQEVYNLTAKKIN